MKKGAGFLRALLPAMLMMDQIKKPQKKEGDYLTVMDLCDRFISKKHVNIDKLFIEHDPRFIAPKRRCL